MIDIIAVYNFATNILWVYIMTNVNKYGTITIKVTKIIKINVHLLFFYDTA